MNGRSAPLPLALIALLLGAGMFSGGCAQIVSGLMVRAPNQGMPPNPAFDPGDGWLKLLGVDQQIRIKVGPPEASLSLWVMNPQPPADATDAAAPPTPRGTILVLHGLLGDRLHMHGHASQLVQLGYRAILVDLRGHGRSSGDYLTFGLQESQDLSQVIDELQNRKLIAGSIGVLGISYGATTAIHLAARDPRIKAVVSICPFNSVRQVLPQYTRTIAPLVALFMSESTYTQVANLAGERAGFDPDMADASLAIQRTSAPVLILHGDIDMLVPIDNAQAIHKAAPDHSKLITLPAVGHLSIWFDPGGHVASNTKLWFNEHLKQP